MNGTCGHEHQRRAVLLHPDRIVEVVTLWTDGQLAAAVPACPDWTVHQLLTPELASHLELSVVAFGNDIAAADSGLAPVRITTGNEDHRTGEGDPGWTLRVDAWEAHRALNSRRTRSELLTLPADGDASPYLDVLHDHLPLPEVSLRE